MPRRRYSCATRRWMSAVGLIASFSSALESLGSQASTVETVDVDGLASAVKARTRRTKDSTELWLPAREVVARAQAEVSIPIPKMTRHAAGLIARPKARSDHAVDSPISLGPLGSSGCAGARRIEFRTESPPPVQSVSSYS